MSLQRILMYVRKRFILCVLNKDQSINQSIKCNMPIEDSTFCSWLQSASTIYWSRLTTWRNLVSKVRTCSWIARCVQQASERTQHRHGV